MKASAHRQRGIAAIEFAGVFVALFLAFYGIASFGALLYTHQAVTRSAEDGARAMPLLPNGAAPDPVRIRNVVYDSLASSLTVPIAGNGNTASRRAWIAAHVDVLVTPGGANATTVSVRYHHSDNQLMPSIPMFDVARWMPSLLIGRATLAHQP